MTEDRNKDLHKRIDELEGKVQELEEINATREFKEFTKAVRNPTEVFITSDLGDGEASIKKRKRSDVSGMTLHSKASGRLKPILSEFFVACDDLAFRAAHNKIKIRVNIDGEKIFL